MRIFDIGARDGEQQVSDRVLTVPNLLSFARLAVLPWVYLDLVNGRIVRATIVAFVFGWTDWFDGYLARRLDQQSSLGKILDPISDRAFFVVIGIGVVVADIVPLWPIALLLARDVLVSVAGLVLLARGASPPDVTRLGKAATFGLMWAIGFWMLAAAVGSVEDPNEPLTWAAWFTFSINIVLSYLAAGDYALRLLRKPAGDDAAATLGADEAGSRAAGEDDESVG